MPSPPPSASDSPTTARQSGGTDPIGPPLLSLLLATLASQLASLAYNSEHPFVTILLPSTVAICVITLPLATLGLLLGRDVGLGAPLLSALWERRSGSGRQLLRDASIAVGLGLIVGLFLLLLRFALEPYLPSELPALGHRGAVGGLLVSISAAIAEEVWLRLGVMTILAWLVVRLRAASGLDSSSAWAAIALAAFAFAIIHLPQLAAAGAADSAGVLGTILGNTLVGVLFGWLYWQRSLMAAIIAHFAVDVVLHVLPAFLL